MTTLSLCWAFHRTATRGRSTTWRSDVAHAVVGDGLVWGSFYLILCKLMYKRLHGATKSPGRSKRPGGLIKPRWLLLQTTPSKPCWFSNRNILLSLPHSRPYLSTSCGCKYLTMAQKYLFTRTQSKCYLTLPVQGEGVGWGGIGHVSKIIPTFRLGGSQSRPNFGPKQLKSNTLRGCTHLQVLVTRNTVSRIPRCSG